MVEERLVAKGKGKGKLIVHCRQILTSFMSLFTMVDLCMYHTCIVYSTCTDLQFHEHVQFSINPMDMKSLTDVQT